MRRSHRSGIAVASVVVLAGLCAPTAAGMESGPGAEPGALTAEAVRAGLPQGERAKWDALTDEDRARSLAILSDVDFGNPGAADVVEDRWDEVDVVETQANASTRARSMQRSHWYSQKWTIFGVTYTEVTTTVGWTANGSNVVSVNRCYGTYTNYVPLRSISSASWSTKAATNVTCKTEWSLGRALQPTVTGVQGLRVSGDGVLLLVWKV